MKKLVFIFEGGKEYYPEEVIPEETAIDMYEKWLSGDMYFNLGGEGAFCGRVELRDVH